MKNNKECKGSKCFICRPFTFFQYQIFISDNIDKAISDALLPVAFSVAPIFKAKKYVLSEVSTYPMNHPLMFSPLIFPVPVLPYRLPLAVEESNKAFFTV